MQGNKASMGGGIYMNASSAAVAKGSALYNNKAAYGGDDLFAFGDRKLTGDGKEITGWYYDGYKENGRTLVGRRRKMALLTMISMTLKRVLPTMRSRLRTA